MGYFKGLFWGTAGFLLGGPIGGLIGVALGNRELLFGRNLSSSDFNLLTYKLCQANGQMSKEEWSHLEEMLSAEEIKSFATDKETSTKVAKRIWKANKNDPDSLKGMLRTLVLIAQAGKGYEQSKKRFIHDIGQTFRLNGKEIALIEDSVLKFELGVPLIMLMVKLSQLDGIVTKVETSVIARELERLRDTYGKALIDTSDHEGILDEAKKDHLNYQLHAKQIKLWFGDDHSLLQDLMSALISVATEGETTAQKSDLITGIADIFGISDDEVEEIRRHQTHSRALWSQTERPPQNRPFAKDRQETMQSLWN